MWCRPSENSSWKHWLYFFLQVALSYPESKCKLSQRGREKQARKISVWACCTFPFLEEFLWEWQRNPENAKFAVNHCILPLNHASLLFTKSVFCFSPYKNKHLKSNYVHMDTEPMKTKAQKYTIISLPEESLQMLFSIAAHWPCSRRLHQFGYPLPYSTVLKMQKVKCFFLNLFFLKGPPAMEIIQANI